MSRKIEVTLVDTEVIDGVKRSPGETVRLWPTDPIAVKSRAAAKNPDPAGGNTPAAHKEP